MAEMFKVYKKVKEYDSDNEKEYIKEVEFFDSDCAYAVLSRDNKVIIIEYLQYNEYDFHCINGDSDEKYRVVR